MFPTVSWQDLPKITSSQMQQLVMLATGKFGLDARILIEHTGRNLSELVQQVAPEGSVLVVAGRGNNGSGGLAAARLLSLRGRRVWVVPTHEGENYSGTPREQLELLRHFEGVRVRNSLPKMNFSCVLDAAIGTRLEGPPRGRTQDVITVMNNMPENCCVISLDAPTGTDADTGETPGHVVRATMTLAVGLPKAGIAPGGHVGRLFVGDVGIPAAVFREVGLPEVGLPGFVSEVIDPG